MGRKTKLVLTVVFMVCINISYCAFGYIVGKSVEKADMAEQETKLFPKLIDINNETIRQGLENVINNCDQKYTITTSYGSTTVTSGCKSKGL